MNAKQALTKMARIMIQRRFTDPRRATPEQYAQVIREVAGSRINVLAQAEAFTAICAFYGKTVDEMKSVRF